MMRCPFCDAAAQLDGQPVAQPARVVWRVYVCAEGHHFSTAETHPKLLADRRERSSALRRIDTAVALYKRNAAIRADPRPTRAVAAEYGITPTRVRQLRATKSSPLPVDNSPSST